LEVKEMMSCVLNQLVFGSGIKTIHNQ